MAIRATFTSTCMLCRGLGMGESVPTKFLDAIKRVVAGFSDLSECAVSVVAKEIHDEQLHLGLVKIDRVPRGPVLDLLVHHSVIPLEQRIAAGGRRAAHRAMVG